MWEKIVQKTTMPHYVWVCICFILVAIGIRILTSASFLIDLNDRTLQVVQKERDAENKKNSVDATVEKTLVALKKLENETPHPEAKRTFSYAQMRIREDIKPELTMKIPRHAIKD